ncbi:MAG: carbohydrate kinase [Phaeodactylibacter sp.]|nr:carbohydrate kinase [Phaeodactylibacter sp.]MCB9289000.1 carbohydrate kinase [Lewinellaceae bacterium]
MSKPTIICFGEVLWDVLPDKRVAGGAPMNVAFHINQLGMRSKMISSVGDDDLGRELIGFLEAKGVSTGLVQTDPTLPTGVVNVMLDEGGSPSYEIVSPVAWDNIRPDDKAREAVKVADALVFGSLACRTEQNRSTLFGYLELAPLRVLDVNLRAPFYSQPLIESLLARADIVKMNDEELVLIAGWQGADGEESAQLEAIRKKFAIDLLILTRGKDGAACLDGSGFSEHPGFPVKVQDTIGSGDSFLASFLSKHLAGESPLECLAFAGAVGALVATRAGGTPELTEAEILSFIDSKG